MKPGYWTFIYGAIFLLSVGLTLFSQRFFYPANCQTWCGKPESEACPSGACRSGEQRAGLPLPYLIDSGAGSSPTTGWGKLGPEDFPNPFTFGMDVAFYAAVFWLLGRWGLHILGKANRPDGSAVRAALGLVLLCAVCGLLLYRPF